MEVLNSIEDLFIKAGGSVDIAAFLRLHQWTVDRWVNLGIPRKHWKALSKKYKVTSFELHMITEKAREANKKRKIDA